MGNVPITIGLWQTANTADFAAELSADRLGSADLALFGAALRQDPSLRNDQLLLDVVDTYLRFDNHPKVRQHLLARLTRLLSDPARKNYLARARFFVGNRSHFVSSQSFCQMVAQALADPSSSSAQVYAGLQSMAAPPDVGSHCSVEGYFYAAASGKANGNGTKGKPTIATSTEAPKKGDSLRLLGRYQEAAEVYAQSGDFVSQAQVLKKYAEQQLLSGNTEEAIEAYRLAIGVYQKLEQPSHAEAIALYVAGLLEEVGREREAEQLLEESPIVKLLREEGEESEVEKSLEAMAPRLQQMMIALQRGDTQLIESATLLESAIGIQALIISKLGFSSEEKMEGMVARLIALLLFCKLEGVPVSEIFQATLNYAFHGAEKLEAVLTHLCFYALLRSQLEWEKRLNPAIVQTPEYQQKEKILAMMLRSQIEVAGGEKETTFGILQQMGPEKYVLHVGAIRFSKSVPDLATAKMVTSDGTSPLALEVAVSELFGRMRNVLFGESKTHGPAEEFLSKAESMQALVRRFGKTAVTAYATRQDELAQQSFLTNVDQLSRWLTVAQTPAKSQEPLFSKEWLDELRRDVSQFRFHEWALQSAQEQFVTAWPILQGQQLLLGILSQIDYEKEVGRMFQTLGEAKPFALWLHFENIFPPLSIRFYPSVAETMALYEEEGIPIIGRRLRMKEGSELVGLLKEKFHKIRGQGVRGFYIVAFLYFAYLRNQGVKKAQALLESLFSKDLFRDPLFFQYLGEAADEKVVLEGKPKLGDRSKAAKEYLARSGEMLSLRKQMREQRETVERFVRSAEGQSGTVDDPQERMQLVLPLIKLRQDMDEYAEAGKIFRSLGNFQEAGRNSKWEGDRLLAEGKIAEAKAAYEQAQRDFQQANDGFGVAAAAAYLHYAKQKEEQRASVTPQWNIDDPAVQKQIQIGIRLMQSVLENLNRRHPISMGLGDVSLQVIHRLLRLLAFCHVEGIPQGFLFEVAKNYQFRTGGNIHPEPTSLQKRVSFMLDSALLHIEVFSLLKSQLNREFMKYPMMTQTYEFGQRSRMVNLMASGELEVRLGTKEEMEDAVGIHAVNNRFGRYVRLLFEDVGAPLLDVLPIHPTTPQLLGEVAAHEVWGHGRSSEHTMIWRDDVEEERIARTASIRHYVLTRFGEEATRRYAQEAMTYHWGAQTKMLEALQGVQTTLTATDGSSLPLFPPDQLAILKERLVTAPIGEWIFQLAEEPNLDLENSYDDVFRTMEGVKYLRFRAHLACAQEHQQSVLEALKEAHLGKRYHRETVPLVKDAKYPWQVVLSSNPEEVIRLFEEDGFLIGDTRFTVRHPEALRDLLTQNGNHWEEVGHKVEAYYHAVVLYYHYLRNMASLLKDNSLKDRSEALLKNVIFGTFLKEPMAQYLKDFGYLHGRYGIHEAEGPKNKPPTPATSSSSSLLQSLAVAKTAQEAADILAAFPLDVLSLDVLRGLEEAIAKVDQDAAHEFQRRRLELAQRGEKGKRDLANVLRELSSAWPKIRRYLEEKVGAKQEGTTPPLRPFTPRAANRKEAIAEIVRNFSPSQKMEEADSQYLETLLNEAIAAGVLERILTIVEWVKDRREVIYVDENHKPARRLRNVKDVLALLLTYLQLEDYERLLGELAKQGISLETLFAQNPSLKYPLEAKQRILAGELDAVIAPPKKGVVAYYAKQLGSIFFPQLPDLSTHYELRGEGKRAPLAAVIVHEASHSSQGRGGIELHVANEAEAIFIEAFYMALRKGREANQKDIEVLIESDDRLRKHWAEQIQDIYGSVAADLYRNTGAEPYAAALRAALSFLDYLHNPSAASKKEYESLFLSFRKTYTEFIVAAKFLAALEKGLVFYNRWVEKPEERSILDFSFETFPKLEIKANRLLAHLFQDLPPEPFLGRGTSLMKNSGVISRLSEAPPEWLVEGRTVLTIEQYLSLYAAEALIVIGSRTMDPEYAKHLIQERLFPLIKFLVEREYFDHSIP